MTLDLYTKIILTIICFSLLGILLKPLYLPTPVVAGGIIAVDLVRVGGRSVYSPLKVKVVE